MSLPCSCHSELAAVKQQLQRLKAELHGGLERSHAAARVSAISLLPSPAMSALQPDASVFTAGQSRLGGLGRR